MMNNPDFYFKYWESIRKKGIYMANQNTSVSEMIDKNKAKKKGISDKNVPIILRIIAICSILVTVGIIVTLLTETITFFTRVPITEFLFSKDWNPFSSTPQYGIWALILGTLKITVIATIVAVPIGDRKSVV